MAERKMCSQQGEPKRWHLLRTAVVSLLRALANGPRLHAFQIVVFRIDKQDQTQVNI